MQDNFLPPIQIAARFDYLGKISVKYTSEKIISINNNIIQNKNHETMAMFHTI